MTKRRRRTCIGTQGKPLPCLVFSYDQLVFLKQTVAALEQVARKQTKPLPNLPFAIQTIIELQVKISTMLNFHQWGKVVEMDTNEILILQSAVKIFEAGLDALPPSPQGEELKKECQTLNLLFAAPSSHITLHD